MRFAFGLLAASLFGQNGPTGPDVSMISYEVQILEMNGLEWRSAFHHELQPVARKGVATVWTAPGRVVARLAAQAGKIQTAPRVSSPPQIRATISRSKTRRTVADMARHASGSGDQIALAGYFPRLEDLTEGYAVSLTGRPLDQGVLTQLTVDDKQITALHTVSMTEPKGTKESPVDTKRRFGSELDVQVPEYNQAQVAGEWLIPNDGVLVVSLGAHTVADHQGKAVVRERLLLIEATAGRGPSGPWGGLRTVNLPLLPASAAASSPASDIPMPAPMVPSRSLPLGRNPGGVSSPLPPLPEDQTPPTSLPGSSEPCATPQTNSAPAGPTTPPRPSEPRDAASHRAGYVTGASCCDVEAKSAAPAVKGNAAPAKGAARSFTFRLPLSADIVIEVNASAKPHASASAPAPPVVSPDRKD